MGVCIKERRVLKEGTVTDVAVLPSSSPFSYNSVGVNHIDGVR